MLMDWKLALTLTTAGDVGTARLSLRAVGDADVVRVNQRSVI